jgi:cell division protein ZipA
MDIKDWILIGGGALLAAVIAHGFWLAWRSRREPLRIEIDPNIPTDDVDPLVLLRGELPNGGARVVSAPPREQATLDLGAGEPSKPVLVTENRTAHARRDVAKSDVAKSDAPRPAVVQPTPGPRKSILDRPKPKLAPRNRSNAVETKPAERERQSANAAPPIADEIIVVHVFARGAARFQGAELMNALLRNSLKFGDMNIFHRVDPISKQPRFSVASAVEPGTFDLAAMDTFSTAGVSFFLRLPGPPDPLATFEDMLGVARDIATSMGGDLKDDQRSVLTAQTIEHCRQRISEFSRKRMSQRG